VHGLRAQTLLGLRPEAGNGLMIGRDGGNLVQPEQALLEIPTLEGVLGLVGQLGEMTGAGGGLASHCRRHLIGKASALEEGAGSGLVLVCQHCVRLFECRFGGEPLAVGSRSGLGGVGGQSSVRRERPGLGQVGLGPLVELTLAAPLVFFDDFAGALLSPVEEIEGPLGGGLGGGKFLAGQGGMACRCFRLGIRPLRGGPVGCVGLLATGAGVGHATLRGLGELTQVPPLFAVENGAVQAFHVVGHANESSGLPDLFQDVQARGQGAPVEGGPGLIEALLHELPLAFLVEAGARIVKSGRGAGVRGHLRDDAGEFGHGLGEATGTQVIEASLHAGSQRVEALHEILRLHEASGDVLLDQFDGGQGRPRAQARGDVLGLDARLGELSIELP
jgi:hypothetical protein